MSDANLPARVTALEQGGGGLNWTTCYTNTWSSILLPYYSKKGYAYAELNPTIPAKGKVFAKIITILNSLPSDPYATIAICPDLAGRTWNYMYDYENLGPTIPVTTYTIFRYTAGWYYPIGYHSTDIAYCYLQSPMYLQATSVSSDITLSSFTLTIQYTEDCF